MKSFQRTTLFICLIALLLVLAGCSDDADSEHGANNADPTVNGPVEAPEARALSLASTGGCAIDADCAAGLFCFQNMCARVCETNADCADGTCSERGRCIEDGQVVAVRHTLPTLKVVQMPETVQRVSADASTARFEFGLNKSMPPEGIAYRVQRSDGLSDPSRVRYATGDKSFALTLETGAARPGGQTTAEPVSLTVFSAVGDFQLALEPEPTYQGTWVGEVVIDSFGGSRKLSLEAMIIEGEDDALSIVLPVGTGHLFSPRDDHDPARDYEMAELVYNGALGVYQAVFVHEFRFDAGIFGHLPARQVQRTMRFDFDAAALDAGRLEGRFTDMWRGLYDSQRNSGELEVATVRYDADFALTRLGPLPKAASHYVPQPPVQAEPTRGAPGELAACSAESFAVEPIVEATQTWSCAGITSADAFRQTDPESRARCALTVARRAAEGETTGAQLARYFAEDGPTHGLSFEQFLQDCADDSLDACQPSEQAHCAYELVAYAAQGVYPSSLGHDAALASALLSDLMIAMVDMAQESFLARKLGAFYADLELRRQWLRGTAAPAVFLASVEAANQTLMQTWTAQVLDVQHEVFRQFFTPQVLKFLSRPVTGEQANEKRLSMLAEAGSLWRSYSDGLLLAAKRWDEVVRAQSEREAHAQLLQQRALELYLVMGILSDFNRAAGSAAQTAELASSFGELTDAISRLNRSFNEAIFARDAEIVVARSLNPLSDNDSLLSERRADALASVEDARLAIESILNEVSVEALQEAEVRTRINDERRLSANRIAEICGLPTGCTENDLLTRSECINVEVGQCGLLNAANPEIGATFDPARVAASEAGQAVLAILEAYHNVAIQDDELAGHLAKLELRYQELEAFKKDVESWNQSRLQGLREMRENFAERGQIRDEHVRELLDNLDERAEVRAEKIEAMADSFTQWNQIRLGAVDTSFEAKMDELQTRRQAAIIGLAGEKSAAELSALAEALPKEVGTSNDIYSAQRAGLMLVAHLTEISTSVIATDLNLWADEQAIARERNAALTDATLAQLSEQADLEDAFRDEQITQLELAMETSTLLRDNELARLEGALELMREQREAELAYSRDMAEFRTKRSEYLQEMVDISGLILRVDMSQFNVIQRMLEYDNLAQKARLESARLRELDHQLFDLDNLVGGMGAVFSKSYALDRTEDHLDQARKALMDWLVVLEYYAVRPFMEQRIQIELARNAYQLEAIAQDMQRLENTCGGAERSKASATLSLRKQVLGLTRAQSTLNDAEVLTPDARFRQWLAQSYVPVNRRIRFSTSQSLNSVLENTDGVLAAAFTLGLDDFANLQLACNAKIESVAVQLVGELGDAQPTATILYDGTSQLRSCQPNIAEYVQTYASGLTAYDTITQLRTSGRAMSPLAGVNTFLNADQSVNRSLAGLPVASEYTLLISTQNGDNARLQWDKLEDVLIRVEYSYQDLFSEACD